MNITQISIGRFHHFHLARQMEMMNRLECIWTGYPRFKLKDETGIPKEKIKTFPWLRGPYMAGSQLIEYLPWLKKEWDWWAVETLDNHVSKHINYPTVLVALSGSGLKSGAAAKRAGGYHICDRGSSHIRFQNQLLQEEYLRWGIEFKGIDTRIIAKEEAEYEQADLITVPSEFVRQSFLQMGIPSEKISKVIYGARLERFKKEADPPNDKFRILWVGAISIRKGFFDLLEAFESLKHPQKELVVVGSMTSEIRTLLKNRNLDKVIFTGTISNHSLPKLYSSAHVFVLPSVEEGLACVLGEALACGCPVIATTNSGAEDLFNDGIEGFIIPIRNSRILSEKLQILIDDKALRLQMSEAATKRVELLGGWDTYGRDFFNVVKSIEQF